MKCGLFKTGLILALFFFGISLPAKAQRPVVSVTVDTSQTKNNFGPNRLFYACLYGNFGLYSAPSDPGLRLNWWSGSLSYGAFFKLRLCNYESFVSGIAYRYERLSIKQKQDKALPLDPDRHQRQRISVHYLTASFANRINFDRRGDMLGLYLDLGVYGEWNFRSANVYVDQYYVSSSPSGDHFKFKTKITGLPYLSDLNYGLIARFGYEQSAFFATYRLNSLISGDAQQHYGDFSRLLIGYEVYLTDY